MKIVKYYESLVKVQLLAVLIKEIKFEDSGKSHTMKEINEFKENENYEFSQIFDFFKKYH